MYETLDVIDPVTRRVLKCSIRAEFWRRWQNELWAFYRVRLPRRRGAQEIAVIVAPNNLQFTVRDWQGTHPRTPDEIADYEWRDQFNRPATILDGRPQVLSREL